MISGGGNDLVFNLAKADGYEEAPVSEKKFREFMTEQTGMKLKPTFNIVDSHPDWSDDENTSNPTGNVSPLNLSEIEALWNKLRPELELVSQHQVGDTTLWSSALASVPSLLTSQNLQDAQTLCQQALANLQAEWKRIGKQILPRVQAILARPFTEQAGDIDKIRAVVGLAKERAAAERLGSATVALVRMLPLLEIAEKAGSPKAADVITPGRVAEIRQQLEKARKRWDAGIDEALLEMRKIQSELSHVDPEFAEVMPQILLGYERELDELLVAAHKAEDQASDNLKTSALEHVQRLRDEIKNDDFLAYLDSSFPSATINLQSTLDAALAEVGDHLKS